jgi:hypothetical protein
VSEFPRIPDFAARSPIQGGDHDGHGQDEQDDARDQEEQPVGEKVEFVGILGAAGAWRSQLGRDEQQTSQQRTPRTRN